MDVPVNCAYRLSSFEPVVESLVRLEYKYGGWSLWIRHRHYSGLFADCGVEEYHSMTTQEIVDVLCATVEQYGPFSCELTQAFAQRELEN